jgi:hypothetical protein
MNQAKQLPPTKDTMDANLWKKLHKEASDEKEPKLTLHLRGLLGSQGKSQKEQDSRESTLSPPPSSSSSSAVSISKRNKRKTKNDKEEVKERQIHRPNHSGLMHLSCAAQQAQEREEIAQAAMILVGMRGDRKGT